MIICSVLEVYETTLIPMCVARKLDQFQWVELLSYKDLCIIQMQLRFQYEFMARIHIISNHFINLYVGKNLDYGTYIVSILNIMFCHRIHPLQAIIVISNVKQCLVSSHKKSKFICQRKISMSFKYPFFIQKFHMSKKSYIKLHQEWEQ